VLEQSAGPDPLRRGARAWHYAVRHLEVWPLGTPYFAAPGGAPGVREAVAGRFARAPLRGCALVVDQTGVGAVTVDHFRAYGIPASVYGVTVTSGEHGGRVHGDALDWRVPKAELVGGLRAALLPGRLRVARVPHADRLRREMEGFSERVTAAGNVVYDAGEGGGTHADLLFAVMLAVWWGECNPPWSAPDLRVGGPRLAAAVPAGTYLQGPRPGGW
jgi:hypothetical protein